MTAESIGQEKAVAAQAVATVAVIVPFHYNRSIIGWTTFTRKSIAAATDRKPRPVSLVR